MKIQTELAKLADNLYKLFDLAGKNPSKKQKEDITVFLKVANETVKRILRG
jgi:hypothetical protein